MAQDTELIERRARVDRRVVLERIGWTLEEKESTRRACNYRHGAGEIVIVTYGCNSSRIPDNPGIMARAQSFGLDIIRRNGATDVVQALWNGALKGQSRVDSSSTR